MVVLCPSGVVKATLDEIRSAGRRGRECGVLWLGRRNEGCVRIVEAYRPAQNASDRMFEFPPGSMAALEQKLIQERYMIPAQVHSHPGRAFHSLADDHGAVIRHGGALSLVVPDFGLQTTVERFLADSKVYRLSDENRWTEVGAMELDKCLRVV